MSELAEIRVGGAAGREGRLQDIVFEANSLRCGADSFDLDWFMTKVGLGVRVKGLGFWCGTSAASRVLRHAAGYAASHGACDSTWTCTVHHSRTYACKRGWLRQHACSIRQRLFRPSLLQTLSPVA